MRANNRVSYEREARIGRDCLSTSRAMSPFLLKKPLFQGLSTMFTRSPSALRTQ